MENKETRMMIYINCLKHWQVAKKIGISESTLSRWLRTPLDKEKEKLIINAIKDLKKGGD